MGPDDMVSKEQDLPSISIQHLLTCFGDPWKISLIIFSAPWIFLNTLLYTGCICRIKLNDSDPIRISTELLFDTKFHKLPLNSF